MHIIKKSFDIICQPLVNLINLSLANNYRPHACRTNLKKFTILYRGPIICNSLSSDIRNSGSLFTFKKKMVKFLIENNP
jgi:hypothetical protein